jgi:hypothetical protein
VLAKFSNRVLGLLESLINDKELCGSIEGKNVGRGLYVPHLYITARDKWIKESLKQNDHVGMCRREEMTERREEHGKTRISNIFAGYDYNRS